MLGKRAATAHSMAVALLRRGMLLSAGRKQCSKALAAAFQSARFPAASLAVGTPKERPLCLADRERRRLIVRGREVPVDSDFWEHVADEQSVREAPLYRNNTENYVGTVKYPVGVIGPLRVNGEHAQKEYVVPLATHERALLASYDRGAKAITEAGGATVRIKHRQMLRAPVFMFRNIAEANDFYRFAKLEDTQAALRKAVHEYKKRCTVTALRVFQTDRKVHVSIGIDSDDAAGQNMVTYAGEVVMAYMRENYPGPIPEMYIEGGFNSGKRISVLHTLLGKGHSIVADCMVPKEVVQRVLHTSPYRLQRFQKMHNRTNEFIGGISCTAHVANGLTAFFIATGNDPACVAESQAAVTHFDVDALGPGLDLERCNLYASITMNSLIVASHGGGTQLPAFRAARSMMGIQSSNELAEVCAAVALAGELSFYAAMESGEFTNAHWSMTHKVT
mmetsp:Transcript_48887/g.136871  ORF Transcript_48887/g.136871 Transcript_48887/m.136871 type:complete len:449 (-) Transcript_48887:151-1497(-)